MPTYMSKASTVHVHDLDRGGHFSPHFLAFCDSFDHPPKVGRPWPLRLRRPCDIAERKDVLAVKIRNKNRKCSLATSCTRRWSRFYACTTCYVRVGGSPNLAKPGSRRSAPWCELNRTVPYQGENASGSLQKYNLVMYSNARTIRK